MGRSFERIVVPPHLAASYARMGLVSELTLAQAHARNAREWPWLPAVVDGERSLTYGELDAAAAAVGAWLQARGVGAGDVVTWQLPNWWETVVVAHAIWRIGAISNPLVTIYREHELRHVFQELRPDAVISCGTFRGFDHGDAAGSLLDELGIRPRARLLVRDRMTGWDSLEDVLSTPPCAPALIDADAPALVLYTSGTTAAPKGAIHTSRTYLAAATRGGRAWGWSFFDRFYMPAPLGHATGILTGIGGPMLSGACLILAERWDPDLAVTDFERAGVTLSAGATVFLQELLEAYDRIGSRPTTVRGYACGGASVPAAVMEHAEAMGIPAFRLYGMTELPGVTSMSPTHPMRQRHATDGAISPGCEVRVVDENGRAVAGQPGELLVRGPQRSIGYVDATANAGAFDADGWFHSGDIGMFDSEGCLTITGRLKDIVNRGGEKISAREIEDVLAGHPAVADAAVVPAPDSRLGEVPAVFIVARGELDPEEAKAYLRDAGLARQKVPVVWTLVDALPRTASGKVRKNELVERLTRALP
jgi:acyl-CoA synthetase